MPDRRAWGRFAASAAGSAVIGWFAFVAHRSVPVFDWFDLAIHETGHLIAAPLPDMAMFMAGSIAQVAFPVAMAIYFGVVRRDAAASGFCTAWAGTSAWDVSVYIADAPTQALPLIGGQHDWAYILGHLHAIDRAGTIAGTVELIGGLMVIAGVGVAAVPIMRALLSTRRTPAPAWSVPVAPTREVRADDDQMTAARRTSSDSLPPGPPPDLLPEDPFSAAPSPPPAVPVG